MQTKIAGRNGAISEGKRAADACRRMYWEASSWRRRVKRALRPLRVTFTQWLLLQTIHELFRETGDAVSELSVATRAGVDRTTVSQVMWKLAHADRVSIGPDAIWPGLRVYLTKDGEATVREATQRVEAASLAWLAEQRREAA